MILLEYMRVLLEKVEVVVSGIVVVTEPECIVEDNVHNPQVCLHFFSAQFEFFSHFPLSFNFLHFFVGNLSLQCSSGHRKKKHS